MRIKYTSHTNNMGVNKLGELLHRFSQNAYTFTVPQIMRFTLIFTGILLTSLIILQRLFVLIILLVVLFVLLLTLMLIMSGVNLENRSQYRNIDSERVDSIDDDFRSRRDVDSSIKLNKKKLQEIRKKLRESHRYREDDYDAGEQVDETSVDC